MLKQIENNILIGYKNTNYIPVNSMKIKSKEDVVNIFEDLKNCDREKIISLLLDSENNVIGTELIGLGSINNVSLSLNSLFKLPIVTKAKKLILIHNHPSGNSLPSYPDQTLTSLIHKTCKNFDIEFLYHLIIGYNEYSCIYPNLKIEKNNIQLTNLTFDEKINVFETFQKKNNEPTFKIDTPEKAAIYINLLLNNENNKNYNNGLIFLNNQNHINSIFISNNINIKNILEKGIATNSTNLIIVSNKEYNGKEISNLNKELDNLNIGLLDVIQLKNTNKYISCEEILEQKKVIYKSNSSLKDFLLSDSNTIYNKVFYEQNNQEIQLIDYILPSTKKQYIVLKENFNKNDNIILESFNNNIVKRKKYTVFKDLDVKKSIFSCLIEYTNKKEKNLIENQLVY